MIGLIENKIRKNWLYALFISCGLGMIFFSIALFTNPNLHSLMSRNMFVFIFIFKIIFTLGWVYIYYRCAYKKPGRKLLAFNLTITPVSFVYTIFQRLNLFPFMSKSIIIYTIFDKIIFILGLVVGIIFLVFSLKLFKLNKKIQNRLASVLKD